MRSLFLLVLTLGTFESFLRPRDPAMDQVANILKGILSNLTKHKRSLLKVSQELRGAITADPALVLAGLQQELARLQSGDESSLSKITGGDLPKGQAKDVEKALASLVSTMQPMRSLLKLPAGDQTVLFVEKACKNVTVDAEALVRAADKNVVVVESSELLSSLVDRTPELFVVPKDGEPRRFEQAWTDKAVAAFVKDRSAGAAQPAKPRALVKAAAAHKSDVAVEAVDEAQLADSVASAKSDMLVTFYAPWCPHCETFVLADNAPLKELAKEMGDADIKGLRVLSVDVTTVQKIPERFGAIQYVPAVFFVPGEKDSAPVAYQSEYSIEALTAFMKEHSTGDAKKAFEA